MKLRGLKNIRDVKTQPLNRQVNHIKPETKHITE